MDLFEHTRQQRLKHQEPLAARMRPRTLEQYVGQEHIMGSGRLLRRAIQADQLSSLIFCGPPGTGKTTLAMVIAQTTRSHFITINAVLAGVKDIRTAIASAQEYQDHYQRRTLLFVDEVHRWNKAQQDALLPWVENGTLILIGATTENPFFAVNRPLVSRSRIFQLKPLGQDDLRRIAQRAIQDSEFGYGNRAVDLRPEALDHLVDVANGDARGVLNALELAVETTPPDSAGTVVIDRQVAEESIQKRAVLYDKDGDVHYDTISAFIKSLRGSDPDAALYWLAKMVYAGEDPSFIFRRMLIFAGEDVGLADPGAVQVVNACAQTFDRIGLPEGRFPLSQAALYLATAPKSNSTMALFDAIEVVSKEQEGEIPNHLRDSSRDKEGFGHGQGYLYPHAYRDHWVAQQYLPISMQGQVFYQPSKQGYEEKIRAQVIRRREAQLAAMVDLETLAPPEILTFSPRDRDRDRWLQRTLGTIGRHLEGVRDRVIEVAKLQRHHLVLDLNAGSGLLTWEAVRQTPEGRVWALAADRQTAEALDEQARGLNELERPQIVAGPLSLLSERLRERADGIQFDAIIGRNCLTRLSSSDRSELARTLSAWIGPAGSVSLAQVVPRHSQRLYQKVNLTALPAELARRIVAAEESMYADPGDDWVNWDAEKLKQIWQAAGWRRVTVQEEKQFSEIMVTPALLDRWFTPTAPPQRSSYAQHLARHLNELELVQVKQLYSQTLQNQPLRWETRLVFVVCRM